MSPLNLETLLSLANSVQESLYLDRLYCFIFTCHPSSQVALLRRQVELFILRGQFVAARDALLDIFQIDPEYLEAHYLLSTFSSEYGVFADSTNDESDLKGLVSPSQRKDYATHVLDHVPRHYGAMIALGRVYRELGTFSSVLQFLIK